MIEEYHFGSITIDGKIYNHDVEVRWISSEKHQARQTIEILKWWRGESHIINIEDVKRAVEQNPDMIVIGTGESGLAKMTETAQKFITEKGIKLVIDITSEAVKTLNVISKAFQEQGGGQKKVIGLLHLTC